MFIPLKAAMRTMKLTRKLWRNFWKERMPNQVDLGIGQGQGPDRGQGQEIDIVVIDGILGKEIEEGQGHVQGIEKGGQGHDQETEKGDQGHDQKTRGQGQSQMKDKENLDMRTNLKTSKEVNQGNEVVHQKVGLKTGERSSKTWPN